MSAVEPQPPSPSDEPGVRCAPDRRACPRYASALSKLELAYGPHRLAARVVDASAGGMALWIEAVPDLAPGQTVDVLGQGGAARATVRHITSLGDDGFRVGIAWT